MQHSDLLSAVHYDPSTGVFTRKVSAGNVKAGSVVGNHCKREYLKALVLGRYVKLHQLVWFYVYGVWPSSMVQGKKHHLGVFTTAEEAHAAYLTFKEQYLP